MKVRVLIDELNRLTKLYDEGNPEISDKEWDDLYFELVELEKTTGEYYPDSPTQRVNYDVKNALEKSVHDHLMLSLDKTKDLKQLKAFVNVNRYIAMAKMDGLTCSLTYDKGRLIKAETRGNGEVGEDITHNAIVVKSIPNKINFQNRITIDGEIICTYKNFENFKEEYKNPRNFAAGSIRLLDSKECEKRNLTFIAWDVITGMNEKENLSDKLEELNKLGFITVPFQWGDNTENDELEHSIAEIKEACEHFGYPIDGIVVKYDNIKYYESKGLTDHHFKGGLAYKFYDDEYDTILRDIVYDIGRTGVLTPVAVFDPVDIDGTECSRASLHNMSVLRDTLHCPGWKGQQIKVFKANQIIPQISWAEEDNEYTKYYCDYPMVCPICGKPTIFKENNGVKVLMCGNDECEGKLLNKLDHFCSKKGLDIKGLSKATLEKLMDWGWIDSPEHIFRLHEHRDEWIKKQGFGVASVDKILKAIQDARITTLDKIIAAAGIPEIGTRVAKELAKRFEDWGTFRSMNSYLMIPGIGEVMDNNLLNFDYKEMDYIVGHYLLPTMEQKKEENNNLEGKVFCITGKTHIFKNRSELQADIEAKGGKVVGSMSSKVTHLINNDNTSSSAKNKAAQAAGIPIITEEEYMEM